MGTGYLRQNLAEGLWEVKAVSCEGGSRWVGRMPAVDDRQTGPHLSEQIGGVHPPLSKCQDSRFTEAFGRYGAIGSPVNS